MPEYQTVKVETKDQVTTVTLNRPEKKNALNPTMHREMHGILDELAYDDNTRVVVIAGAGDCFCAGNDLKEFFIDFGDDAASRARVQSMATDWRTRQIRQMPKPVIAAVHGWCVGGAMSIIESCDIAVAADDAKFVLSEINFRFFPGGPVTKSVTLGMRRKDAIYYALTGEIFDGRRAAEIGWVTRSVPQARLWEEVLAIAEVLKAKDPVALRVAKEAYRYSGAMDWEAALSYSGAMAFEATVLGKNAWQESGIMDFLHKEYRPAMEAQGSRRGRGKK
jgi:trans-feruloyl-CoA hydratase/vanillin synthase